MFLLNDTYFTGETNIPNLPKENQEEDYTFYGSAYMTQTAGETNLKTFIDNKVTEYLNKFFGSTLTEAIAQDWFDHQVETEKVETLIINVLPETEKKKWVSFDLPEDVDIDFLFQNFAVDGLTLNSETFFGTTRIQEWGNNNGVLIRLRVKQQQNKIEVFVNDTNFDSAIAIKDVRSAAVPRKFIRDLLNVLMYYNGEVKVSPMANYVYYWLNRDAANGTTATGEADLNFSRASSAYEADKRIKAEAITNRLVRSWNGMCDMNKKVISFLANNSVEANNYSVTSTNWRNLTSYQNKLNL